MGVNDIFDVFCHKCKMAAMMSLISLNMDLHEILYKKISRFGLQTCFCFAFIENQIFDAIETILKCLPWILMQHKSDRDMGISWLGLVNLNAHTPVLRIEEFRHSKSLLWLYTVLHEN